MTEEKEEKKEINIFESDLVPRHILLTEEQKSQFLDRYNVSLRQLPRIKHEDAVIKRLGAKRGDIIHIVRTDPTLGDYDYYRVVV